MILPNLLSISRVPLALLLMGPPPVAVGAIGVACLTDILDGYLARKWGATTSMGAVLDPACDKFFALFALSTLYINKKITLLESLSFLSRECALIVFFLFLCSSKRWKGYQIKAFISGKVMTSLQFVAFLLLFGGLELPAYFYTLFWVLGATSLVELFSRESKSAF